MMKKSLAQNRPRSRSPLIMSGPHFNRLLLRVRSEMKYILAKDFGTCTTKSGSQIGRNPETPIRRSNRNSRR